MMYNTPMKKQSPFKSRLFFSYSALALLSVGIFLLTLMTIILRTGESEARAAQNESALSAVRQVESALRELDSLAAQVASNAELIGYFIPLTGDLGMDNYFDDNLLDFIDASSVLATLNGAYSTAARVSVYNAHGDYVSAGRLYETPGRVRDALLEPGAVQSQLDALSAGEGRRVVLPPHYDRFSTSSKSRLFSILRPLSSMYLSEIYGVVNVQQDIAQLERLNLTYQREGSICALITADGQYVLPQDGDATPLTSAAIGAALSLNSPGPGELSQGTMDTDAGRLFVSAARMDLSGWLVVMAQPVGMLRAAYREALLWLGLGGLALLIVLLGVVYFMADRITRPLATLSASIERISLTNMELASQQPSGISEVEALDAAFRTMLSRLNDSIGLEMRAYLYALQSQMNPHFLYNVLSVISAGADDEGAPRTVRMVNQLSAMLRYVAAYDSEKITTLRDEVWYAEKYLQLMKVRYEDNFHYSLDMDEGAERIAVPKLILQPLAENCFKHGFLSVRPPWTIRITIRLQENRFLITVSDNGSGLTDERIAQLNARIESSLSDLAGNYRALSADGMGLTNTVLRLKLMLGEGASYQFQRSADGGAVIQIGGPQA